MTHEYKDIKEIAKEIRKQVKKEFPTCKFSVSIERYSGGQSLNVALMEAPFECFANDTDVNGNPEDGDYAQLNEYQLRRDYNDVLICNGTYLTREAWDVMKRTDEIQGEYNWDKSDRQSDYFNVNYWYHSAIGKWNKAFQVVVK